MTAPPDVLMLSGFWPTATDVVIRTLLAEEPAIRLIRYETTAPGSLHRTVSQGGVSRNTRIGRPGDDALSGLLGDLATASHGTATTAVVLPQWCEPDRVREAWRVPGPDRRESCLFVTVVAGDHLLDGLAHDDTLRSVELHQDDADERTVGDVVARQVEQADSVVVVGVPEGDDAWEAEQLWTLVHRLAPWASHLRLADERPDDTTLGEMLRRARRTAEPIAPAVRGLRGLLVGVDEPAAPYGVSSCVFRTRRPFHPGRLKAALDEVTDQVLRSRGNFWLASRPDLVLSWESTGTLTLGPVSGWLADLPGEHWADVDELRQVAASLDWDPYYGDRHSHLVFIGIDLDPVRIHRILHSCLLNDAELSGGEEAWRCLPDPFARAYPSSLRTGRPP
jgi:G3E family GTPase